MDRERIFGTRDKDLAHHIARTLAGITKRSFYVTPRTHAGQPLYDVEPVHTALPKRKLNAFSAMASALAKVEKVNNQ